MMIRINKSAKGFKVVLTDSIVKVKNLLNAQDLIFIKNMRKVKKQVIFYIYSVPTPFVLVFLNETYEGTNVPQNLRAIGRELLSEVFALQQRDWKVLNYVEHTTFVYLIFQGVILNAGFSKKVQSISFENGQINGNHVAYLQAFADSQAIFLQGINNIKIADINSLENDLKLLGINGLFRVQKINEYRLQQGNYFQNFINNSVNDSFAYFQLTHRHPQAIHTAPIIIGTVLNLQENSAAFWFSLALLHFVASQNLAYNFQVHCLVINRLSERDCVLKLNNGKTLYAPKADFSFGLILDWLLYIQKQEPDAKLITLSSIKNKLSETFDNEGVLFSVKSHLQISKILNIFEKENEFAWPLPNNMNVNNLMNNSKTDYDLSKMNDLHKIALLSDFVTSNKWLNINLPQTRKNKAFKTIPEGWFSLLRLILESQMESF